VKQAEDEITSASMVVGASFAGTRAMCGTSGGGFDLMSETLSLAGISETPFVAVLAQRPGPGTGAPTWTAQGDLNMALHTGHGEFPRILLGTGDTTDSFFLTIEAHNLAEKYQTPVIVLTDKYLAESFYSTPAYDESQVKIDRGQMLKEGNEPDKTKLRYQITENGVSDRWIPGDKISPFLASSDEHTEKGYSTEEGDEIATMISKRLRKLETIRAALPEPEIFGANVEDADALVISWGSNKQPIIDVQKALAQDGVKIAYMHVKYLWPLKTEFLTETVKKAKKTICIEANSTGQLSNLIAFETKQDLPNRILKFDGRPFFFEELINSIKNYL
jgi:2-oxoglutarate ferredoxin oxidoreductase subunit alpha